MCNTSEFESKSAQVNDDDDDDVAVMVATQLAVGEVAFNFISFLVLIFPLKASAADFLHCTLIS